MIFYFSGTGNSQWVAEEIARLTADKAVDITGPDADRERGRGAWESLGFVFPIYAWGIPEPMARFAHAMRDAHAAYTFGVCTYGAEAGYAMRDLEKIVPLDGSFGIAMPSNYIIASDREDDDVINGKLEAASLAIEAIAKDVRAKRKADRVNVGVRPFLKSRIANVGFNRFARTTKPFYATNACDGCGLCEKRCPAHAIELVDGTPKWSAPACYQCLRCLNECPQSAIQYGKSTEGRKRYALRKFIGKQDQPR